MASLTDPLENEIVNAIHGHATFTAVTTPMKLRLVSAVGSDATAGTAVTGGSYAPQTYTPVAASGGATSNSNLIRFDGMPAGTVAGCELWDSSGTPRRIWHTTLSSPPTMTAGQALEFAIGAATFTLT